MDQVDLELALYDILNNHWYEVVRLGKQNDNGMCGSIRVLLREDRYRQGRRELWNEARPILERMWVQWPQYSGVLDYPIPATKEFLTRYPYELGCTGLGHMQYYHRVRVCKWTGRDLEMRESLRDYTIGRLHRRLEIKGMLP